MAKKKHRRKKKEQNMGRIVLAMGLLLKIIQILGAALSISSLTGTTMTLITSCLLVGGLCVYAVERMNLSAAFAMVSVSGILGGIIPSENPFFTFAFMAVCFFGLGALLISTKKRGRVFFGIIVLIILMTLALQYFGIIALQTSLLTIALSAAYCAAVIGLFI